MTLTSLVSKTWYIKQTYFANNNTVCQEWTHLLGWQLSTDEEMTSVRPEHGARIGTGDNRFSSADAETNGTVCTDMTDNTGDFNTNGSSWLGTSWKGDAKNINLIHLRFS